MVSEANYFYRDRVRKHPVFFVVNGNGKGVGTRLLIE